MNNKVNADKWVKLVYNQWLPRSDTRESYLRVSTKIFAEKMRNAAQSPETLDQAWVLLERLKKLSENFQVDRLGTYRYEQAQIYLECALTAYWLRDLNEAQQLIMQAIGNLEERSLNKAFAYWVEGCIFWLLPSRVEDAVFRWELALQTLQDKKDDLSKASPKNDIEKIELEMQEAVRCAAREGVPPAPEDICGGEIKENFDTSTLKIMPVIGEIPAGVATDVLYQFGTKIDVKEVLIDDKAYEVFSPYGAAAINMRSATFYFALKVIGDSMNLAKPISIFNGNYVLLRDQNDAEDGDIVAAEIVGYDTRATLKRYRFRGSKHILEPESSHPDFQDPVNVEYAVNEWDDKVVLRGVVVAVLKPV